MWGKRSGSRTEFLLELAAAVPFPSDHRSLVREECGVFTPLRFQEWERALSSHSDRDLVKYVYDGIRDGFRVGFDYPGSVCKSLGRNMKW